MLASAGELIPAVVLLLLLAFAVVWKAREQLKATRAANGRHKRRDPATTAAHGERTTVDDGDTPSGSERRESQASPLFAQPSFWLVGGIVGGLLRVSRGHVADGVAILVIGVAVGSAILLARHLRRTRR